MFGLLVDLSGTITLGGTAQNIAASQEFARRYLFIQNVSAGDLWINFDGVATLSQPSIKIATGSLPFIWDTFIPQGAISIIGATTAQAFVCKEAR